MGAWGYGPFDSDSGLDYLDNLAHALARRDEDDEIVAGSVDQDKIYSALEETLTGLTDTTATWEVADAYAAAGLVTAALRPDLAHSDQRGTRLFSALAGEAAHPTGLDAHCGLVAMVEPDTAARLRPAAVAALRTLLTHREWLSGWSGSMLPTLSNVLHALEADATVS